MARPQLRPLSVGETLDATFTIYRSRFSLYVTIVAIVLVPIGILTAILNVTTVENPTAGFAAGFSLTLLVVSILTQLAQLLAYAAVVKAVAAEYLGEEITWQQALAAARDRLGALIVAGILIAIGVAIGLLLLIIPGLFLLVSWALTMPAIVVEKLGATEALGRSWSLVGGRRWPIFGVFIVLYIIISIVSLIVGSIFSGIVFSGGSDGAVFGANLVVLAGQVITVPLLAIAVTVVYFDQRVRKEGFDLELLAQQVGGTVQRTADPGIATDPGISSDPTPPSSDANPPPEATDGWPPAGD